MAIISLTLADEQTSLRWWVFRHKRFAISAPIIKNKSMSKQFVRRTYWTRIFVVLACMLAPAIVMSTAHAEEPLQSTNYRFEESVLGGGGLQQSGSANYRSTSTLGESATGESASSGFQVQAGNKTSPDPVLSFTVNNGSVNFGSFSASTTASASATFSVSNYTSYGYAVQIIGNAPTMGSTVITPMTSTDSPIAGMKQFGINLVANTIPSSLGANPDQGQFGFGTAAPNYGTSNQYRFVSGEAIATAPKSSGVTNYTISYIVNVDGLTPGGQYKSSQTLICTGTF